MSNQLKYLPASIAFILLFSNTGVRANTFEIGFGLSDEVIEWSPQYKLKISDFKAKSKGSPGFAVATTTSAFGFEIVNTNGKINGSIFVRFLCDKSWWNPDYYQRDVLQHEQLHFDICELFGRKLYKEILKLRKQGRLNQKNIERLQSRLEEEYDEYQDLYDFETDHSVNTKMQVYWNKKIKHELEELSAFANYHNF